MRAGRYLDARARRVVCAAVRRVTSPRLVLFCRTAGLAPSEPVRRRRASGEPRASRRADRAPSTPSCVRWPFPRRTCASCRVRRRASSDHTARRLICRTAEMALSEPTPAAETSAEPKRVVVSTERRRPRRACAGRSLDARARRVVCVAVRRVTSLRLVLLLSHRWLGCIRADPGDVERAPSRERVVVSTEHRRRRRACTGRAVDARARRVVCAAVRRVASLGFLLFCRTAGSAPRSRHRRR